MKILFVVSTSKDKMKIKKFMELKNAFLIAPEYIIGIILALFVGGIVIYIIFR